MDCSLPDFSVQTYFIGEIKKKGRRCKHAKSLSPTQCDPMDCSLLRGWGGALLKVWGHFNAKQMGVKIVCNAQNNF